MRYEFRPIDACDMCGGQAFVFLGMRLSASQGMSPRRAEGVAVPVKKCRGCGLIFADPQPVPEDILDHYGVPPEDYWKNVDFEWTPEYFATEIDTAKHLLDFTPGMKALDIGVGLGKAMKSLCAAEFDVWGIEPSPAFRDRAIAGMALDPKRVQLARVERAEFEDETFDFITFGAVLEHLSSPSLALERAMRWLKTGGIIQVEVPSSSWLVAKIINAWFRFMGTNYVTHISPMHSPFHLFEFGPGSFVNHGRRAGYDIAHQQFTVCSIPHAPRVVQPMLRWWMERTGTGMQLTVYLRKLAP